jgi:hypothetical protein
MAFGVIAAWMREVVPSGLAPDPDRRHRSALASGVVVRRRRAYRGGLLLSSVLTLMFDTDDSLEGIASFINLCENIVGRRGPDEGLWMFVVFGKVFVDRDFQVGEVFEKLFVDVRQRLPQ